MTQGERVKEVRKSLGFTLERFGENLGVGKTAISNVEKGNRNLTEQMAKSICREYNVSHDWLTTGEGKMRVDTDKDFFEKIDRIMCGENDVRKNMIKTLLYASDSDIESLNNLIDYYIDLRYWKQKESVSSIYDSIPDTPEEFEKLYPPVENPFGNKDKGVG